MNRQIQPQLKAKSNNKKLLLLKPQHLNRNNQIQLQLQRKSKRLKSQQSRSQLHQRLLRKPPVKSQLPSQAQSQRPMVNLKLQPPLRKQPPLLLLQKRRRRQNRKSKKRTRLPAVMRDYQMPRLPQQKKKCQIRIQRTYLLRIRPSLLWKRTRSQNQKRKKREADICSWRDCLSSSGQSRLHLTLCFLDTSPSLSHFLSTGNREC